MTGGSRSFDTGPTPRAPTPVPSAQTALRTDLHVGVIFNRKARRNPAIENADSLAAEGVAHASPETHEALDAVLADFAARGVNALVIVGGDGTVRDVTTVAPKLFPDGFPLLTLVPSGKTNALALDLGIPAEWSVAAAIETLRSGRIKQRAPIEIVREGSDVVDLRGFILGSGAFVRATGLAQRTHQLGAFNGVAVGLSILGTLAQTLFGGRENVWRRGDPVRLARDGLVLVDRSLYLLLASTLKTLPLGIKPFGTPREGLKLLAIDAPPKNLLRNVPPLLAGSEAARLDAAGYHHIDADRVTLKVAGFVLDGEAYPGGTMTMRQGAPIDFAVP